MASERFSLTVLPVSTDAARPFHVSLHIAPRLTPSKGKTTLGDFPLFSQWSAAVSNKPKIRLLDQSGTEIAATPLLKAIAPRLWPFVFPSNLQVKGQSFDSFKGRRWRTFPAKGVHDAAMMTQFISFLSSPDTPPLPSAYPFTRAIGDIARRLTDAEIGRGRYDESRITKALDNLVAGVDARNGLAGASGSPVMDMMVGLHQARRFYERPEAVQAYRERPEDGAAIPPLDRPEPDFHEQVAHIGDQPELMRRLGLVIDLKVADLTRLAAATELRAELEPENFPNTADPLRTPMHRVGTNLLTVPASDDWQDGSLKLGDTSKFAVLVLDADGSALKLDRFFWTLPRLLSVELNGDPAHAAPPAMRVGGLTVVQNGDLAGIRDQLDRTDTLLSSRGSGQAIRLATEDVTRGFRVEVWDATAGNWFSLHEKLVHTEVDGFGEVFKAEPSAGFVQGSGASETPDVANGPVHVHDALFGWSGWSLSAPRPGPRVRHDMGKEVVEPTTSDPQPVTPVHTSCRVTPGTLPRLRYGRSYAFRAWSVDLAGNSPPHAAPFGAVIRPGGPPPAPIQPTSSSVNPRPTTASSAVLEGASAVLARNPLKSELPAATITAFKAEARQILANEPRPDIFAGAEVVTDAPITGTAEVDSIVKARLAALRRDDASSIMRPVDIASSMLRTIIETDAKAEPIGELTAEHLVAIAEGDKIALTSEIIGDIFARLRQTVTALIPYLRWEPVAPPVLVARHSFSQAESIRHLVIRSGVELSAPIAEGGTISVADPGTYATQMTAAHSDLVLDYRAASERHIAPPKGSLEMAELHGRMDAAIGSTGPAIRKAQLAIALRDDGTLIDVDVVDAADPALRHPQPGIRLAAGPEVPGDTLVKLEDLKRGDPPAPGQYVVHDIDELVLPYLPDPLAHGVSIVFPDAGKDRGLPPLLAVEGVVSRYPGNWPFLEPFRLVLETAPELIGRVESRVITIGMPPGAKLDMRLSSMLTGEGLELLGLWRLLPKAIRDNPILFEPAIRGWFWAFTPFEDVTLVHAVPRPLEAPTPTILVPERKAGDTAVALIGALDCHGPSTDRIDAEASWIECIDDLAQPAPTTEPRKSIAFTTSLDASENLIVLGGVETSLPVPGFGTLRLHGSKHELNDTKHRVIDYAFRGTTRFREYFPPIVMDDPDQRSILGAPRQISVPSTVRPPAPLVHSVLPLFRWEEAAEPNQPFATRRRRRAGFRIYLERPWFASGEGELLGVLVGPGGQEAAVGSHISQWGSDPIWAQAGPKRRAIYLELDDLLRASGFDNRPAPARPVAPPALLPLTEAHGALVQVLGYKPEFQPDRNMWFVDVAVDPGTAVWPFVRLAVVRYQPDSLANCHLSPVVHCVFTQLTVERTATLSRPDKDHARLVVSGSLGFRLPADAVGKRASADPAVIAEIIGANHRFLARLERLDPAIPTDLGWRTEVITELQVVGFDPSDGEFAWMGILKLPVPIDPARPGDADDWRVTVEEWEAVEADPIPYSASGPLTQEWRIVYADQLNL